MQTPTGICTGAAPSTESSEGFLSVAALKLTLNTFFEGESQSAVNSSNTSGVVALDARTGDDGDDGTESSARRTGSVAALCWEGVGECSKCSERRAGKE
ncbi:hypothetical protein GSI_09625 [Ganoderma sinense ZZ0214-1]|uniref:Uncharacterized protein n=1 Tax=Ganoderma sinense ZZ0214-1 TaxID=1077348 RepID=A0A2G8S354_9APHY|nr:hypothetical protein GSI_09625 [Ganoderma sinense ZZ0214-1]